MPHWELRVSTGSEAKTGVFRMQPFSATLEVDPTCLRDLRTRIATWLEDEDINGGVSDAVVLAVHEAAASAIEHSPQTVSVDATVEGRLITIVVASDERWTSPEVDHEGQRMRVVRAVMSAAEFEARPGRTSLRLEKRI